MKRYQRNILFGKLYGEPTKILFDLLKEEKRLDIIPENIFNLLDNKETRKDFINYYFRKEENIPFLIVKDVYEDIYYRINYVDLINVLVDNLEFYITKGKVKILCLFSIKLVTIKYVLTNKIRFKESSKSYL
jgi:hypothetical protein